MSALLRRRQPRARVIDYTVGRTSLADVAASVFDALAVSRQRVCVQVNGFDYFDQDELTALTDMATWSPRVQIVGLESFVDHLLPAPRAVDVRSAAERAITHLSGVTVVTATADGAPLGDHEMDEALRLAVRGDRGIVTIDLRHVARLSPAQALALAETSAEMHADDRMLIFVNTTEAVGDQLRTAGLSGGPRIAADGDR
ncbi:MAG: hypothetical protein JO222_05965 [Frankiales bacterium]|nr:hypothetical protein [Frankiales bacterium]